MKIRVKFFGSFRQYGNGEFLEVEIKQPMTLNEFRLHFENSLKKEDKKFLESALISDSVFANETQVLTNDYFLEREMTLAILPPVCGG